MDKVRDWADTSTTTTALFLAAIGTYVVTVAIGILNGLDLVEFDHNTLMTHVHAGTLGWITLSVFAVCGWMFGAAAARRGGVGGVFLWACGRGRAARHRPPAARRAGCCRHPRHRRLLRHPH